MAQDLTEGKITPTLLWFALPMILGDLLQQTYNIADTLIVGRFIGKEALAAAGSSYTLMIFLNSILLGLCMGSGTMISVYFGKRDMNRVKQGVFISFLMIGTLTLLINAAVFAGIDGIMVFLQVPKEVYGMMRSYLWIIFWGIGPVFLYNYAASIQRAIGNSVVPLLFLGVSAVLNIVLDLFFVLVFGWGIEGAAAATVLAQIVSGVGICLYSILKPLKFRMHVSPSKYVPCGKRMDTASEGAANPIETQAIEPSFEDASMISDNNQIKKWMKWDASMGKEIFHQSFFTSMQQSVMNFGILLVQGLVNSFGPVVMAAFAAAVKIDSFAYMPVQDFGNAFSTFVAQNFGAGKENRIQKGIRSAFLCSLCFGLVVSAGVCLFAEELLLIFIKKQEIETLAVGIRYLRIEGAFYCLIGFLFLFYGYFRGMKRPGVSVVLTVISLGTRVVLAYLLSRIPTVGVNGIWAAVPIGWFLADAAGILIFFYLAHIKRDQKKQHYK